MDPHAVLGVAPGAPAGELTAAYRALAKRWHPDRGGGTAAEVRMAEINAAYELLRSGEWQDEHGRRSPSGGGSSAFGDAPEGAGERAAEWTRPRAPRKRAGAWLSEATRRALGPELLAVLREDEQIRLVVPVSVWASPQALLAVTDRRLLWLLDDAVTGRVRSLDLVAITAVDTRLSWPTRRTASVRVARRGGRRPISFGGLRPETARTLSSLLRSRAAAA